MKPCELRKIEKRRTLRKMRNDIILMLSNNYHLSQADIGYLFHMTRAAIAYVVNTKGESEINEDSI